MQPGELFVFAGAGVSVSQPAALPAFAGIRDAILSQLGMGDYFPAGDSTQLTERQQAAVGLAPEPFLLALQRSNVQLIPWLRQVLSNGSPNAAHAALAQLAAAGARVWTVNFDTLVEDAAAHPLRTAAWPRHPSADTQLHKPHGTLTGDLIVTSEQVLAGIDAEWERKLRADVAGRTVVFIGYSARDLDFQPIWDNVLREAAQVYWFDVPAPDDQQRKSALLRETAAAGKLHFLPASLPGNLWTNPSREFVTWCQRHGLVTVDDDLLAQLDEPRPSVGYPDLGGPLLLARATAQQVLGDVRAARRTYRQLLVADGHRRSAAAGLVSTTLNHGGRLVGAGLSVWWLVPPVGGARRFRALARRKRATILANQGRHRAVLRVTNRLSSADVSTLRTLRAGSLRMTGSLDEAAEIAETALQLALREQHPVRVAHAAFQRALSLVWAYRLPEATTQLEDRLRPYASIAANRWMAWADFVEAGLAIHQRDITTALRAIESGTARFRAEALVDGLIDMHTLRLTALRLAGDDPEFRRQRDVLERLLHVGADGVWYTRGHRFTREAVALEDAEFARLHTIDNAAAEMHYRYVADSAYPMHAALGHLGLATLQLQRGESPAHAHQAAALGHQVNARLIITTAAQLAATQPGHLAPVELFFP
jgi:SIR2-like domain